jgi:Tol biopolymer transport system component
MATGRRAFSGRSQASLISAILTSEPPSISAQHALCPTGFDQLVRTCLAKDPLERWQSARDVVLQLRALAEAQPAASPSPRGGRSAPLAWGVAGLAILLLLGSLLRLRPTPAPPAPTVKFTVAPPAGGAFTSWAEGTAIAVSPDGSTLAFVAREANGPTRLWVRPLAATESRALPGSEDAGAPFWSPDGRSLAFTAQGKLKRVDLAGGSSVTICDVRGMGVAGTWGRDSILFVVPTKGETLLRVPAAGGTPLAAIELDRSKGERRLAWPAFLPDGEHFLYGVRHQDFSWHLMLAGPEGPPREIGPVASAAQFAGPGHLVFVREGTLVGQPFDWRTGTLSGQPIAIAETVRYFLSTGSAAFSASRAGTLAYQSQADTNRLAWFDRAGHEQGGIGSPGLYLTVSISPDGRRVLYDRARAQSGTYDIWSWDVALRGESRLTSDPDTETCPRWLPGGAIVYSATLRAGPPQLVRRDLATGQERELLTSGRFQLADDVSPDGRTLLYSERGPSNTTDIWALALSGAAEPRALLATPFDERGARFSPDGRYLAFVSDESGRSEAYVMPYPGPGEKQRISRSGARALRFSRDGRELFLLSPDNRLWSVPIQTAPAFQAGTPTLLFAIASKPWLSFDVTPDGQRILAIVPEIAGNEFPATVVVNWAAEAAR